MVCVPLAAMAGTALVQAMVTDDCKGVQAEVVRLFERAEPAQLAEIGHELDATRQQQQQLAAASPGKLKQAQAVLAGRWQTRFVGLLDHHPEVGTELIALVEKVVEDLKPVIASAGTTPQTIPDKTWQTEMQTFIVGRYDRVQTAAQTWLTIMTTLFGVFSTVVVVNGAKTIKELKGGLPWQIPVIIGAFAVFALAFAATMYGLFASWGGLGADLIGRRMREQVRQPKPDSLDRTDPKKRVWRKLLIGIWRELKDIPGELKEIGRELKDMWSPKPLTSSDVEDARWRNFGENTRIRANRNRERLHRSRVLGVFAVTFTGLLAFALILNGFFY
jgi:hypothetical protein